MANLRFTVVPLTSVDIIVKNSVVTIFKVLGIFVFTGLALIAIIVKILAFPSADSFTLYGRYVDYDCNPIYNIHIEAKGSQRSLVSMYAGSSPKSFSAMKQSDINGEFSVEVKGERIRLVQRLADLSDDEKPSRKIADEELSLLKKSVSPDSRLVLYHDPYHKEQIRRQQRYKEVLLFENGIFSSKYLQVFGAPSGRNIWYRYGITKVNGEIKHLFELTAEKGGFYEIRREDLPFEPTPPHQKHFAQALRLELANTPGEHIKKAFYFYANDEMLRGTLIMDLVRLESDKYLANYVIDSVRLRYPNSLHYRSPSNPMSPPTCGGILAFDYDGYYVNDLSLDRNIGYATHQQPDLFPNLQNRQKKPDESIVRKAWQRDTPLKWMMKPEIIENRWTAMTILDHPRADENVVRTIYEYYKTKPDSIRRDMFYKFVYRPNTPEDILLEIIKASGKTNRWDQFLAANKTISDNIVEALLDFSFHKNDVLKNLIKNTGVSSVVLDRLLMERNLNSRYLMLSSNVTSAFLQKVAEENMDNNKNVPLELSWNSKTPTETLGKIFTYYKNKPSRKYKLKFHLAHNPSSPPAVLTTLSEEEDIHILSGVYCNPNTPSDIKTRISSIKTLPCLSHGLHFFLK
jgi:hypothetical protein